MLVVWPSEAAAEEALARDLRSGEARLLDAVWADFWPSSPPHPVEARLALRAACAPEGGAATTRGYLSAAARFVEQAERTGLTPADLRGAPGPLPRIFSRLRSRFPRPATARPVEAPEILFKPRLVWEPGDVERILDLARRARVTVELYWGAGRPALFEGMDRVVRAFEAHPEIEGLELRFLDLDEGLAGALFRGTLPPPRPGPEDDRPVEVVEACSPDAEARAVAARVRRLVDAGTPPEEIAVVSLSVRTRRPALPSSQCMIDEELGRVGILVDDRRGAPVLSSPAARLVLDLLLLPERRFAREDVLAVIGSRYVDFPDADRVRRDARARGTLRLPLPPLSELPPEGTLADHAAALSALIARLGIAERAGELFPEEDGVDAEVARDQAAMEAVEDVLLRLGRRSERTSRAGFAAVLADVLAETSLSARRWRGGAVERVAPEDLGGRSFEHVFLIGLTETPPVVEGLYGDRERRALNQHLRRRAFPDDEERAPFASLLLAHAVSVARQRVVLSYPTSDGERGVERARFVDEVLRAAPWLAPTSTPRSPVWPLAESAAPADLLARASLELWSDPAGRLPPSASPGIAEADMVRLRDAFGPRLARVEQLAAIERRRWRYFAGDEPAHEWVGAVPGREAGNPKAPLTARQLEQLANCPWTFFASRVLGVEPPEEMDEAAPPQTVGALAHRILDLFYRRRAQAGALPPSGKDDDRAVLAAACAAVFGAEGARGHAGLWDVLREKLFDDLWRLVQAKPGWDGRPDAFELAFGPIAIGDVWVKGRMDRVDVTPGGPVVVDYKLGSLAVQKLKLRDETRLQLPVYAAAAQALYGGRGVAAYASIRDGGYTQAVPPAGELPSVLSALAGRVREGVLETAPVDCRGCQYRTVCRVVTLAERDAA